MTQNEAPAAVNGEALARRRKRRALAATFIPGLVLVGGLGIARRLIDGPATDAPRVTSPTFAIVFALAMILCVVVAAVWHHRVIDEQDERAIHWSNTVGLYAALVSAMIADVFAMAGLIPHVSHVMALAPAMALALLTYGWNRFR